MRIIVAGAGSTGMHVADVLAGVSMGSIVAAWNGAGFTAGTGKQWNYTQLRQVLTRARNAGLIEYDGEMHTAANLFDALKEGYYGKF